MVSFFCLLLVLPVFLYHPTALADEDLFGFDPHSREKAAEYLYRGLNPNVKPCDNFFEHVCGNYNWNNESDHESAVDRKQKQIDELAIKLIKEIDLSSPNTPAYKKGLGTFFGECVKTFQSPNWELCFYNAVEKRIGDLGLREHIHDPNPGDPVEPVLLSSDQNLVTAEAWRLLGVIEREMKPGIFLTYFISDGPVSTIFFLISDILKLHNKGPEDFKLMIENVTKLLNDGELKDPQKSDDMAKKIADLCSELLSAVKDPEKSDGELFDDTKASLAPNFMWKEFLRGMIPPAHLEKISEQMKLYLVREYLEMLDSFGKAFQKAGIETIRLLTFLTLWNDISNLTPNDLEMVCLKKAKQIYTPALSRLFLDHFGRNATTMRLEILQFTRNIITAFRLFLNAVTWVDADEKDRIHQKLDSIEIDPGLQDWLNDDREISKRVALYDPKVDIFENYFNGRKCIFDYMIQRIVDGVFVSEPLNADPYYPSFYINAAYIKLDALMHQRPRIHVCSAIAFPPLFDVGYPAPVKYGGIGSVLGHELMHAFDSENIHALLQDGRPLLKEAALQTYKEHQECLAAAYSHHCTDDRRFCLKGNQVLKENMADIAGVKIAYAAYKFITQMVGQESSLAPLNNYTGDQLFFMAHARFWCEKGYHESQFADSHSPNKARVEIGYSHIHEFGIAFQCPKPSKYLPKVKCEVWGDMAEQNLEKFRPN